VTDLIPFAREVRDYCDVLLRKLDAMYADLTEGVVRNHQLAGGPPIAYQGYCVLFKDVFPQADRQTAFTLCAAGYLYYLHLLLNDRVSDEHESLSPVEICWFGLASSALQESALQWLGSIFDPDFSFWSYLSTCQLDFVRAVLKEKVRHTNGLSVYPWDEMQEVAIGKSGIVKAYTSALALLTGKVETIEPLSRSQDMFNVARQLFDDFQDWKQDYRSKAYTYLLSRAILGTEVEKQIRAGKMPPVHIIGELILEKRLDQLLLEEARGAYRVSIEEAEKVGAFHWISSIREQQSKFERMIHQRLWLGRLN